MRILILLNSRYPTHKAYGIQVETVARGFAEEGAEIGIAYPRRSHEAPTPLPGIQYFPFGPFLVLHFPRLFNVLRLIGMVGVGVVLRSFQPDVVITNDPVQAAFLPSPWRVIWDLHDVPDPKRFTRRWLVRRIMKRASGIISTNDLKITRLKKFVTHLPPIITLPNPITFDPQVYRAIDRRVARQQLRIVEDECAVVYAGQLYDWKGVDTLIQAAKFLHDDKMTIHIIGGQGQDLMRCQKLAERLPEPHTSVIFHGLKSPSEIPYWLRAADVVVIPNSGKFRVSVEDTNPLKLYEALAAGAATVVSDLPSIREVLKGYDDAVAWSLPDDPAMLAQKIKELYEDPERVDELRERSQQIPLLRGDERAKRVMQFFHHLPPCSPG